MRKTLALSVACLILAAGTAFAYDDCSCTCEGSGQVRRVSDAGSRDGYFLRNGKVMVFRNGASTELTQDAMFDNGMRLQADGTILYSDGTRATLRDSQMLAMDGNFFDRERVNAGFQETRGRDGYFVGRNGKVMSFRDGKISEITSDITFDNGARLSVDGTFTMKDGTRSRLDNSQWMSFSGELGNKGTTDNRTAADVSNRNNANVNDANKNQPERRDNTAQPNTTVNDANRNQPERRENKVESQPSNPPAQNQDIKNDPNRNQAGRNDANKPDPNTNAAQTPDKNDANRNQTGRNDASKTDNPNTNANANPPGRGNTTPENQKKDNDQK